MSFIRVQNLKRDDVGAVIRGSAEIIVSTYAPGQKHHSKQSVRENLGKVLWLHLDKKSGIFLSPVRGLVGYDASKDEFFEVSASDDRLPAAAKPQEPARHVVFGDAYVLLEFMKARGILGLLRNINNRPAFYARLLGHICHAVLRDCSRISCDDFLEKSFLAHLLRETPASSFATDTPFFTQMADDRLKTTFFQAWAKLMKKLYPEFGGCCYVDSTPLPNDVEDNPYNALCSHGTNSCGIQTRLALILDEQTGLPVWYCLIPGNVLDLSTLQSVREDVYKTLGVTITSLVLDAGYASKENLAAFADPKKFGHLLLRMPAKKGYPFKTLYWEMKDKINKGKYAFARHGHTYFGEKKEIEVFGHSFYAFIYVDQENALNGFRKYLDSHEGEYGKLRDKDKDYYRVKFGYFVLLSNTDNTSAGALDEYFGRTSIEGFFKTSKEHMCLLPLRKWTETTIKGKLFFDMISIIVYLELRKKLKASNISVSSMIGKAQSLMCLCSSTGNVNVDTPSKGARLAMEALDTSRAFNKPLELFLARYLLM